MEIDSGLLRAAFDELADGDDKTIDLPRQLISLIIEYMSEDLMCDYSVCWSPVNVSLAYAFACISRPAESHCLAVVLAVDDPVLITALDR